MDLLRTLGFQTEAEPGDRGADGSKMLQEKATSVAPCTGPGSTWLQANMVGGRKGIKMNYVYNIII